MECDDDGVVAKILMAEGSAGVEVGTLIALVVEEGQDWKDVAIPAPVSGGLISSLPTPVASSTPAPAAPSPTTSYSLPTKTGPAASLLLSQYGLNPATIEESGPKGNLTKADVLGHIKANSLPIPSPPQVPLPAMAKPVTPVATPITSVARTKTAYIDIELSSMRKVINKCLADS